ncbi:MAG: hypothetical protein KC731_00325, partial [Myxococcales bacterium]|nr:hypothetical protein [Myxococcales bacterium]
MTTQRFALGLAGLLGLLASTGCATPKIVEAPQTTLGSIVIYKNGVAYFERYADPKDKTLTLRVPVDRVDDFLKSLSIVDEKTGEPFPISYPTAQNHGDYVDMTIPLPDAPGRLKITYVTESPSWKPSYRIVLDDGGKARLQGWAVVDNTSGEDWKGIRVGVGSTSALSFRYDLHSVRLVERETLTSGEQLALAPPSGGTPYAVATRKVRVLGNIGAGDLAALDGRPIALETTVAAGADSADEGDDHGGGKKAGKVDVAKNRAGLDDHWFDNVRAQAGQHRIRVEGFAQTGDGDPGQASLERANKVKEKLVAMGVPDGNIDVVATGQFNREAVRVLATEQEVA